MIKNYFTNLNNLIGFVISVALGTMFWGIIPDKQVSLYLVISATIIIATLIWILFIYTNNYKIKIKELNQELDSYKTFNNIPYPKVIKFSNVNGNLTCLVKESKLLQQNDLCTLYYQHGDEQTAIGVLKVNFIQTDGILQSSFRHLSACNTDMLTHIVSNDVEYIKNMVVIPSIKNKHYQEVFLNGQ